MSASPLNLVQASTQDVVRPEPQDPQLRFAALAALNKFTGHVSPRAPQREIGAFDLERVADMLLKMEERLAVLETRVAESTKQWHRSSVMNNMEIDQNWTRLSERMSLMEDTLIQQHAKLMKLMPDLQQEDKKGNARAFNGNVFEDGFRSSDAEHLCKRDFYLDRHKVETQHVDDSFSRGSILETKWRDAPSSSYKSENLAKAAATMGSSTGNDSKPLHKVSSSSTLWEHGQANTTKGFGNSSASSSSSQAAASPLHNRTGSARSCRTSATLTGAASSSLSHGSQLVVSPPDGSFASPDSYQASFALEESVPLTLNIESGDLTDLSKMGYKIMTIEHVPPEYKEIVENATEEYRTRATVWAAGIYTIIKDLSHIGATDMTFENWARMGTILPLLILNVLLQMSFPFWIWEFLVIPNKTELQEDYKAFHSVAFQSGKFDIQAFNSLGETKDALCSMALSSHKFIHSMVLIWSCICFDDLREDYRSFRSIVRGLPSLPSGLTALHQIYTPSGSNKEVVVCLKCSTRAMLVLFVFIPRLLVWIGLILVGTAFLYSTASRGDVILNSCALSFVVSIDDLLFKFLLPLTIRKEINDTRILFPGNKELFGFKLPLSDLQRAYAHNLGFAVATFSFVILSYFFQPIIPGYEYDVGQHCPSFEAEEAKQCKFLDFSCFPKS